MSQEEINHTIAHVRHAATAMDRTMAAQHLATLITPAKAYQVNHETIAEVETLLDSPEDSVRYWVAVTLGNLGPRAEGSAAKLLQILPHADCLKGNKTSAESIRFALKQIGVTAPPPPTNCD